MFSFLSQFSDSFLLALFAWPFIAAFLTLPILIWQYRRYNRLTFTYSALVYAFILYMLGLASFTLYPMPDNPAEFCRIYNISPQLIPFNFISDIASDGMRAVLQVVMNVAFFIPLGIFAGLLFRWKFLPTLIGALLVSLFIETAQLTGAFGYYPCSYRLFDVDDLMLNTSGALLGLGLAAFLPKKPRNIANKGTVVTRPGALRRLVGFSIDQLFLGLLTVTVALGLYFTIGNDAAVHVSDSLTIALFVGVHFIIPYLSGGRSIGGLIVRMRLERKGQFKNTTQRLLFYLLRLGSIGAVLFAPYGLNIVAAIIVVIVWWRRKRVVWDITRHKN